MVYAMFMVFLLFLYIQTINSQLTTTSTPTFLYGCSFVNRTYLANAAVANQFQFVNSSSVKLIASYSFLSSTASISTFEIGLIYPFSTSTYLVPFPIILDCGSIVSSCQLQTVAGSTLTSRYSEPIVVPLTPFNYSSNSISLNQMGLYLRQGQYQLSNCSINNGQYMTDPQTIFNIEIDYEEPVGKFHIDEIDTSMRVVWCTFYFVRVDKNRNTVNGLMGLGNK